MRSLWFRGATIGGAGILALGMLVLNGAFEAAGSIPDVETCGFLSGHFIALLLLYPLCAGLVAARTVAPLIRRFPDRTSVIVRCGGLTGFGGAALYFGAGVLLALCSPHPRPLPPIVWFLICLYTALATLAGRAGAAWALERSLAGASGDGR